jgi:hypothetical protein
LWRARQAGHPQDLLLVEHLAVQQRRQRLERGAMVSQQSYRFGLALVQDTPYLAVHELVESAQLDRADGGGPTQALLDRLGFRPGRAGWWSGPSRG